MRKCTFPYTLTKKEEKGLMIFEAEHLCEVMLMDNRYDRYQGKEKIEVPFFRGTVKLVTSDHTYMYLKIAEKAVPTVTHPAPPEVVDKKVNEETQRPIETSEVGADADGGTVRGENHEGVLEIPEVVDKKVNEETQRPIETPEVVAGKTSEESHEKILEVTESGEKSIPAKSQSKKKKK